MWVVQVRRQAMQSMWVVARPPPPRAAPGPDSACALLLPAASCPRRRCAHAQSLPSKRDLPWGFNTSTPPPLRSVCPFPLPATTPPTTPPIPGAPPCGLHHPLPHNNNNTPVANLCPRPPAFPRTCTVYVPPGQACAAAPPPALSKMEKTMFLQRARIHWHQYHMSFDDASGLCHSMCLHVRPLLAAGPLWFLQQAACDDGAQGAAARHVMAHKALPLVMRRRGPGRLPDQIDGRSRWQGAAAVAASLNLGNWPQDTLAKRRRSGRGSARSATASRDGRLGGWVGG